jgi:5-methylcytosine-specific restriction protein A
MKITEENVNAIYDLANEVYTGRISQKDAVELASNQKMMSSGSAQGYIQNFRYIMEGFVYKRTMNLAGTRCFLERICKDYGKQKLQQALEVVSGHVQYYNSLGYGKQVQTQELIEEFQKKYNFSFQDIPFPDEIDEIELNEGAKKQVIVNSYERNIKARLACIVHYGAKCIVCDFDFAKMFGDLGIGYIHVHHELDLAQIGQNYVVDPIKDLKPVCPNCHAMLHKTKPAMAIKKLKEIIANFKLAST